MTKSSDILPLVNLRDLPYENFIVTNESELSKQLSDQLNTV